MKIELRKTKLTCSYELGIYLINWGWPSTMVDWELGVNLIKWQFGISLYDER